MHVNLTHFSLDIAVTLCIVYSCQSLDGPRPWICKDFNGCGMSQALDLECVRWIWRVTGLGFGRISMDLEGHMPWIWKDVDGFGVSQALDFE